MANDGNMYKKVILEFDDIHHHDDVDCLEIIEKICGINQNIILNFFCPAFYNNIQIYTNKKWCSRIKELINSNNINLGIHGYCHSQEEMLNKSYKETIDLIKSAENMLYAAGLNFSKTFRAPHWSISQTTMEALIHLNYTHIYSHIKFSDITDKYKNDIKVIIYNYNFKDDLLKLENENDNNILVCHGHTSKYKHLSCNNSIWDSFDKIKYFSDNKFEFYKLNEI